MRKSLWLAVTMTFALVGCGKKSAKNDSPPTSTGTPQSSSKNGPPGGIQPKDASAGGAVVPGGGVVAGSGSLLGGGGSGGAAQAIRKAVKRTAELNDLKQIHLFIETYSGANGKMPTAQLTYETLQKEAPKIAAKIDDGTIILWMAKTRDEVWAYEEAALESGGQVITSSGVERMEVAALKQRLGVK